MREPSGELARATELVHSAKHVVAFSGAGLSAESGVPTFRGASTDALWARYDPTELASPGGFSRHPDVVLAWYADRRRRLAGVEPNAAHVALAARPDVHEITQNVDDLLERAGATDVMHLHGHITFDRCHARCGHREPVDLAAAEADVSRRCPKCGAALRPDVVWFGEALDEALLERAGSTCAQCDVMIVIGTSGTVWPAAGLVEVARDSGAAIIVVNTERNRAGSAADAEIIGPAGRIVPRLLEREGPASGCG